jgi:hypothetical protein
MYFVDTGIPAESKVSSSIVTRKETPVLFGIRPLVFAVFFIIFTDLARRSAALTGIAFDLSSFAVGLVVAALTAFMAFRVEGWWSSATLPRRPTWTYIVTRAYTPSQARSAMLIAIFKVVFVMLVVIAYFVVSRIRSLP